MAPLSTSGSEGGTGSSLSARSFVRSVLLALLDRSATRRRGPCSTSTARRFASTPRSSEPPRQDGNREISPPLSHQARIDRWSSSPADDETAQHPSVVFRPGWATLKSAVRPRQGRPMREIDAVRRLAPRSHMTVRAAFAQSGRLTTPTVCNEAEGFACATADVFASSGFDGRVAPAAAEFATW